MLWEMVDQHNVVVFAKVILVKCVVMIGSWMLIVIANKLPSATVDHLY